MAEVNFLLMMIVDDIDDIDIDDIDIDDDCLNEAIEHERIQ